MSTNNDTESSNNNKADFQAKIRQHLLPQKVRAITPDEIRHELISKVVEYLSDNYDSFELVRDLQLSLEIGRCAHELQYLLKDQHFLDYIRNHIIINIHAFQFIQQCQFMYENRVLMISGSCLDEGFLDCYHNLLDKVDEQDREFKVVPIGGPVTSTTYWRPSKLARDIGPFKSVNLNDLCAHLLKHGINTTTPKIICDFLSRSNLSLEEYEAWRSMNVFGNRSDIRENLNGLCLVPVWEQLRLPLWFDEDDHNPIASPYLAFGNRLVDLSSLLNGTGPGEQTTLDSRHFSLVRLPFDYDPTAACPEWQRVLAYILAPEPGIEGEQDQRIALLQEMFGWCLLTGNQRLHLEKFFVLFGNGANGKSTVLKILEALLGEHNVSHVPLEAFDGDFKLFQMAEKLANISFDMSRPERISEGILKSLVSGEPVQVNRKYKEPVTLYPTANLFFATNELPSFADRSDGLWRRAVIIPFNVQIPKEQRDPTLAAKLQRELPGIFDWALEGAKRLMKNKAFTDCGVCQRVNEDHRLANDHFLSFMQERTEWKAVDPKEKQPQMFPEFKKYCEDYLGVKATGKPKFEQRLKDWLREQKESQATPNDSQKVLRSCLKRKHKEPPKSFWQ